MLQLHDAWTCTYSDSSRQSSKPRLSAKRLVQGLSVARNSSFRQVPRITIHADNKGSYSTPPMTVAMRSRGFPATKARMERLTSHNNVRARHKRRYRVTTIPAHKLPVAPTVLNPPSGRPSPISCSVRKLRTSGPAKAGCI